MQFRGVLYIGKQETNVVSTQINNGQIILFALPAMVSAIMHGPIAGIIPSLYATNFGLDLAVIGSVLLVARVFDAITDPLIGYMSDRTRSKFGKRKPWVVFGAAVTVISCYLLFSPGEHVGMTYFLVFSILLYLGWTLMEIPYAAWVLELSRDTKVRTKIAGFRSGALFLGGIIFTLAPMVIPGAEGRMGFEVLGVLAVGILIAVPLTTALMVKYVPQGDVYDEAKEQPKISELWGSIKGNKPFQAFIAVYVFVGLAGGISGVLSFMYMDAYLGLGDKYTQLFIVPIIIGPLVLPFWVWLLNRADKYRTTAIAFGFYTLIMPLPWFISPGVEAFLPMAIYYSALTVFSPLLMVSMPTILGDVIDYDESMTGKNRAGQYYSFLALVTKGTVAVGGPLALLIIGLFGYQPGAAENSEQAIFALRVVNNLLPALMVVPGVLILWYFPLNDKKQKKIREQLESQRASEVNDETLSVN